MPFIAAILGCVGGMIFMVGLQNGIGTNIVCGAVLILMSLVIGALYTVED